MGSQAPTDHKRMAVGSVFHHEQSVGVEEALDPLVESCRVE